MYSFLKMAASLNLDKCIGKNAIFLIMLANTPLSLVDQINNSSNLFEKLRYQLYFFPNHPKDQLTFLYNPLYPYIRPYIAKQPTGYSYFRTIATMWDAKREQRERALREDQRAPHRRI